MCKTIGWLLRRTTSLGRPGATKLVQLTNGYSVAEREVPHTSGAEGAALSDLSQVFATLVVLGIKRHDGTYVSSPESRTRLVAGDKLVLYGRDDHHATLNEDIAANLASDSAT